VATVNFIRVDSFFGGGVATPIYLNSKLAAKLRTETYTTLPLKPGRYDISTAKDRMKMPGAQPALAFHGELVFSPGETYYVLLFQEQYGIDQNGWPAYWIKFEIINSDKANEHMSGYEFIALNAD
jgi:hypothetical protein